MPTPQFHWTASVPPVPPTPLPWVVPNRPAGAQLAVTACAGAPPDSNGSRTIHGSTYASRYLDRRSWSLYVRGSASNSS